MAEWSDEFDQTCRQCGLSLVIVGTCCWSNICGDCEDSNEANSR